jgi:hypothetical protein
VPVAVLAEVADSAVGVLTSLSECSQAHTARATATRKSTHKVLTAIRARMPTSPTRHSGNPLSDGRPGRQPSNRRSHTNSRRGTRTKGVPKGKARALSAYVLFRPMMDAAGLASSAPRPANREAGESSLHYDRIPGLGDGRLPGTMILGRCETP